MCSGVMAFDSTNNILRIPTGTVRAITSDGVTAWTADASHALDPASTILPDFQGGSHPGAVCNGERVSPLSAGRDDGPTL